MITRTLIIAETSTEELRGLLAQLREVAGLRVNKAVAQALRVKIRAIEITLAERGEEV